MILNVLWLITALLLVIGLTQPMFTFTHFYFFDDTFSLVDGIFHLAAQGEFILFGLLFLFSLVMPVVKMLMLLYNINAGQLLSSKQRLHLDKISKLGKWSMLDVYVIAILAVTVKLGMIASVAIHFGLVAFAVSVTLSMLLPLAISALYHRKSPLQIDHDTAITWRSEAEIMAEDHIIDALKLSQPLALEAGEFKAQLIDVYDKQGVWQVKAHIAQNESDWLLLPIASR
nr:paraquat-inducible protein A [Psychrobium sp. MM17-31]